MKLILFSIFLILLGVGGAYFANVLTGKNINMLYLYASIGTISTGIMLLIYAFLTKRNELQSEAATSDSTVPVEVIKSKSLIDRNNQFISEWSKTGETRDRLKLLELSARMEESKDN